MKKSVTYRELQKFDNLATAYLRRNEYFDDKGWTKKEPTKLVTNIKNVVKQCAKHFETYKELVDEIHIDNCLVDEKTKAILREENGTYKFSKEGLKEVSKKIKDLAGTSVDLHVRITEGNLDLSDEEKEAFNGIVIPAFEPNED